MADILGGLVLVNGTDIWTEYGVFLVEDRRGGMENLTAILTPSKAKKDTAVDIREEHGAKCSVTSRASFLGVSTALYFSPCSSRMSTACFW